MYDVELFGDPFGLFSAVFVFGFGFIYSIYFCKKINVPTKIALWLYLYHTLFSMVYLYYVLNNGGDALGYYFKADKFNFEFRPGTFFIYGVVYFLKSISFSIVGIFLVFNFVGVVGLYCVLSSLLYLVNDSIKLKRLAVMFIFLPSMSFWTSAIGKDAISFAAIGLTLYSCIHLNKRVSYFILAIFLMFLVRPHIASIMIIAFSLSLIFNKSISLAFRFGFGGGAIILCSALLPFALKYAGVDGGMGGLDSYIDQREGMNLTGGSSLDLSSMSLPEKMFTYLFRPLLFDARSITQVFSSIDNLFILYIIFFSLLGFVKKKKRVLFHNEWFLWTYSVICWLALSMTTANLGIAVRQKWMFVPALIFILLPYMANSSRRNK